MRTRFQHTHSAIAPAQRLFYGTLASRQLLRCGKHFPVHDDPSTWPAKFSEAQIRELLKGNLTADTNPHYEVLAMWHAKRDIHNLAIMLRSCVNPSLPREVLVEKFLTSHLNNIADKTTMELPGRGKALEKLTEALSLDDGPSSQKCTIVFSCSPRGSGKTQFIQWSLTKIRHNALKYGRVIVRCCDQGSQPWLTMVMKHKPSEGLCELIRGHVASVTGRPQAPENYSTPEAAYKTWEDETNCTSEFLLMRRMSNR